jgi:medium-chain acyl-[acyl-carrier-protein] hydrolase
MYRPWAPLLPDTVDLCAVNLPGREARTGEPLPADLGTLVDELTEVVRPVLDLPVTFFGHSLGALLAFEVSQRLRDDPGPPPAHLVVSGFRPPHVPEPNPPLADLPDDQLIQELRRLNGTDEEILGNPAAISFLLPILRADFGLAETYRYAGSNPLSCPITVLSGSIDPETATVDLDGWRVHTTGAFTIRVFPGDHFFVDSARPLVVAAAVQTLMSHLVA